MAVLVLALQPARGAFDPGNDVLHQLWSAVRADCMYSQLQLLRLVLLLLQSTAVRFSSAVRAYYARDIDLPPYAWPASDLTTSPDPDLLPRICQHAGRVCSEQWHSTHDARQHPVLLAAVMVRSQQEQAGTQSLLTGAASSTAALHHNHAKGPSLARKLSHSQRSSEGHTGERTLCPRRPNATQE